MKLGKKDNLYTASKTKKYHVTADDTKLQMCFYLTRCRHPDVTSACRLYCPQSIKSGYEVMALKYKTLKTSSRCFSSLSAVDSITMNCICAAKCCMQQTARHYEPHLKASPAAADRQYAASAAPSLHLNPHLLCFSLLHRRRSSTVFIRCTFHSWLNVRPPLHCTFSCRYQNRAFLPRQQVQLISVKLEVLVWNSTRPQYRYD